MSTPETAEKTLLLGHSPDPDDAFMHYALAADKLDCGGLHFEHKLEDIETLNRRALKGEYDISIQIDNEDVEAMEEALADREAENQAARALGQN